MGGLKEIVGMITLNQLIQNKPAEIKAVADSSITAKLTDMGLYPGKKVRVLYKAPLGDPIAIDVEGYTLGLRLEEAALIKVAYLEEAVETNIGFNVSPSLG